jgi:hypothetical protein
VDDIVTKEHGLAYVYATFPKQFKAVYKGKGHEAGDLRRFMEMYKQWNTKIFAKLVIETKMKRK